MAFKISVAQQNFVFNDLKNLLAKATPLRSGDCLAGLNAATMLERTAAQMALADLPLTHFLNELVIPYEDDEVSRLIIDIMIVKPYVGSPDGGRFSQLVIVGPGTTGSIRLYLLPNTGNGGGGEQNYAGSGSDPCGPKCEVTSAFRNQLGLAATWRHVFNPITQPILQV